MVVRRIKQMISTRKFLKVLLPISIIVVMYFYLRIFFTTGMYFENTFLRKEVVSSSAHYIGKGIYGNIHITVNGIKNKKSSADVIYRLPNDIIRQYTVNFKDASNWDSGIKNIKDKDGNIIFEGEYRKNSPYMLDKNEQLLMDGNIQFRMHGTNPYKEEYEVPLRNVADIASFANDIIRGRYVFLILAVTLFLFTWIDMKFPLFFFKLNHILTVKNPEPSEFYLSIQRTTWWVCPLIGLILMLMAITFP